MNRLGLLIALLLSLLTTSASYSETYNRTEISRMLKSEYASWGITQNINNQNKNPSINLLPALKIFKSKKTITVAVVDTGINPEHPFLKNNITFDGKQADQHKFGLDFSQANTITTTPHDEHGHGTHVSGIIKSIFPDVKILPLKYYNPKASGQQNLIATLKALKYAVNANVDIINYSGGGPEPSKEELEILTEAQKKGIIVIAAAGNESSNIDQAKYAYYPASYKLPNIITVNAYNQSLDLLPSSNYGKYSVDIAAPGYRIRSASLKSASYMSGTSQATAFVTGVVALIKSQHPTLNYEQIRNIIISSADHEPKFTGKVLSSGKLNAHSALVTAQKVKNSLNPSRSVARKK